MKKKLPVNKHVTNTGVSALARETGLSPATISKRMQRGQSADHIRQDVAQRKGQTPRKAPNDHGPGRAPDNPAEYELVIQSRERFNAIEDAKLRRQRALAERQELENMVRRGELLPVPYVRLWASRFLIDGRDTLLMGPSELADTLAAESDPLKVAAILRAWLERAMAKFQQLETLWAAEEKDQVA